MRTGCCNTEVWVEVAYDDRGSSGRIGDACVGCNSIIFTNEGGTATEIQLRIENPEPFCPNCGEKLQFAE